MKKWIARGLGMGALVASLVTPAFGTRSSEAQSCLKVVKCSDTLYCCDHCQTQLTTCMSGN